MAKLKVVEVPRPAEWQSGFFCCFVVCPESMSDAEAFRMAKVNVEECIRSQKEEMMKNAK